MTKTGQPHSRSCAIYALCDPRLRGAKSIRYIGKADDAEQRRLGHIKEAQALGRTHKQRWIRELLALGLEPKLRILEKIADCKHWQEREIFWIDYYQSKGLRLTNIAPGGMGGATMTGRIMSWRVRRKIRKALAGKKMSEEAKKKIAEANRKREYKPLSPKARKNISKAKLGKKTGPRSEAAKQHMREAFKGRPTWNKGKPISESRRQRIIEGLRRHRIQKEQTENE